MKKRLSTIVFIIFIIIFAIYFFVSFEQFKILLNVNLWLLSIIVIANLTNIASNGLFIKIILKPYNKIIPILESIFISLISSVGNFFAPVGGGLGLRAVYLKKKFNLTYSDFISTLYGNYIIVFLVNSFVALVALYLLREKPNGAYYLLLVLFSGIFGVCLILSLVKVPVATINKKLKKKPNKIVFILLEILKGWNRIVENKKLLLQLILLSTFNLSVTIFISWLEIKALHLSISLPSLLLFSVLGSLSLFVNITPANLGVKEAIFIFSGSVIGFSTSEILSIALVDRGILFLVLFVSWLLMPRLSKLFNVSIKNLQKTPATK
ncbi:MAG: flippase-like domain-containing protein [bacterium]|nr:flippase-like domain-containing protein [bacterium]